MPARGLRASPARASRWSRAPARARLAARESDGRSPWPRAVPGARAGDRGRRAPPPSSSTSRDVGDTGAARSPRTRQRLYARSMARSAELVRPRSGRMIAAVCAALAWRFDEPWQVRLILVLSRPLPGPQLLTSRSGSFCPPSEFRADPERGSGAARTRAARCATTRRGGAHRCAAARRGLIAHRRDTDPFESGHRTVPRGAA